MKNAVDIAMIAVGVALLYTIHGEPSPPPGVYWLCFFSALALFLAVAWTRLRKRPRPVSKSPAFAEPYVKPRTVRLTPQALTALNRQRHITGRPALSPAGFYRAIQAAPADRRLESQNDWLLYFLLFDVHSQPGHPSQYCQTQRPIQNALEILPGGGEFGGAGASGAWSQERLTDILEPHSRSGAVVTAGAFVGAGLAAAELAEAKAEERDVVRTDPVFRDSYSPVPPAPFVPTSEPTPTRSEDSPPASHDYSPSYSAPDPTPSYSPSESSSPSYGGGDSGGGFGGGGGDGGGG